MLFQELYFAYIIIKYAKMCDTFPSVATSQIIFSRCLTSNCRYQQTAKNFMFKQYKSYGTTSTKDCAYLDHMH